MAHSFPTRRSSDLSEVIAVEGDEQAAAAARANAEANGLEVTVVAEAVGTFARRAGRGPGATDDATARATAEPPDVVVLDPPRTGAGEGVIAALSALRPAAIVYVACDVAALSRDTRHLADAGYELRRAAPLDLFPMTHHVEVVATFTPGARAT